MLHPQPGGPGPVVSLSSPAELKLVEPARVQDPTRDNSQDPYIVFLRVFIWPSILFGQKPAFIKGIQ